MGLGVNRSVCPEVWGIVGGGVVRDRVRGVLIRPHDSPNCWSNSTPDRLRPRSRGFRVSKFFMTKRDYYNMTNRRYHHTTKLTWIATSLEIYDLMPLCVPARIGTSDQNR